MNIKICCPIGLVGLIIPLGLGLMGQTHSSLGLKPLSAGSKWFMKPNHYALYIHVGICRSSLSPATR